MVFLWYRRHSRALGALTSVHPIDVFCPYLEPSAGFNNARPQNSLHSLTISSFSLRIRLTFIILKPVCYASPEPRSSVWDIEHWNQLYQQDRSLMCLCRLTNVSIVRMKKGGKRFEVSFAVQELKTSLISR